MARLVLSYLARILDPLGLLAPITFLAKHLMQLLWTSGIGGWDDPIPEAVNKSWQRYQRELKCIQHLTIPRPIMMDGDVKYELHAFSDSSEKGYAAAIYLRCDPGETVQCHLITAKTKVSPLKRVTIPRLELCGAVLAAQLLHHVQKVLKPYSPSMRCTPGLPPSLGLNRPHIGGLRSSQTEPASFKILHHLHYGGTSRLVTTRWLYLT